MGGKGQLADFIEENAASFGNFEKAFLVVDGAGERAFLMAEEFAFEERFGQRGTIKGEKQTVSARAVLVDSAGGKLLAGPAFAIDQHGGFAGSDALDESVDLLHARAVTGHIVLQAGRSAQLLVFDIQALELTHVFDGKGGQTCDGRKELKVVLGKRGSGIGGVQINDAEHPATSIHGNAENGVRRPVFLPFGRSRVIELRAFVFEDGDTLGDHTASQRAIYMYGMIGSGDTIPGYGSSKLFRGVLDKEDCATLRRTDVEDHAQ